MVYRPEPGRLRQVVTAGAGAGVMGSLRLGATTLAGSLLGTFTRFLEAVGLALDGDNLRIMNQAIDQRHDAGGVGENAARKSLQQAAGDRSELD